MPLSWLYGLGVGFRNLLFEMDILKSRSFKTPVISMGNITVGGTGKTPHVEYLIRLLKDKLHVAVLSRGYKRKSKGFRLATGHSTMEELGDEPYQMKRKYPDIDVAVDKKRTHGIEQLISGETTEKEVDVILLDDAFQHRYVKPGINILLVDYNRNIIDDKLLPAGRLRETLNGKNRADIVIITKCPKTLTPMDFRVLTKQMDLYPYQQLFFTTIEYEPLCPVFDTAPKNVNPVGKNILLLTGIAAPKQMEEDLRSLCQNADHMGEENQKLPAITPLSYPDHHNFRKKDVQRINDTFAAMPSPKIIVTTEKDAARLTGTKGLSDEVRQHLYALPIKVSFMLNGEETFNEKIISYVRKNSRNSILAKTKNDDKPKDSHHSGDRPRTISFRNN
ncbi:MAG: tetraacyldisaccharide 4'-kinase [Prevotella sp.]|nr:tetraacyldisaccharide 4'-kinase [Prevotella sp.]